MKIDWLACLFLTGIGVVLFFLKKFFLPEKIRSSLAFSDLNFVQKGLSIKERFYFLPVMLYWSAFILFSLAFIDPHLEFNFKEKPQENLKIKAISTEGVAFYLLLDQSGSMSQSVLVSNEQGGRGEIAKIDLMKKFTETFINARSNDLIGLIYFARIPRVVAPLTLDHSLLISDLKKLKVVEDEQNDGTSLGYAIFKAAHLIVATRTLVDENSANESPQFHIKNTFIIAVTDGMQDPNHLDKGNRLRTIELEEVADFAKKKNIKLYIINIDPSFATEKFAPHRRQMQKITQLTGGSFYLANDGYDLKQIYTQIDQQEKFQIPQQTIVNPISIRSTSFYFFLISVGMGCFFLACLLESLYFKSFP